MTWQELNEVRTLKKRITQVNQKLKALRDCIRPATVKYTRETSGKVRNAETKQILKPLPRKNRKVQAVRVMFEWRRKECSVQQLLWEVHGKPPKLKARQQIAVTICSEGARLFFPSLNQAAIFLRRKTNYTKEWIQQHFAKRAKEVFGWQIMYHEPEQRKFRSVDAILESKYFHRENKYWSEKNDLRRVECCPQFEEKA